LSFSDKAYRYQERTIWNDLPPSTSRKKKPRYNSAEVKKRGTTYASTKL